MKKLFFLLLLPLALLAAAAALILFVHQHRSHPASAPDSAGSLTITPAEQLHMVQSACGGTVGNEVEDGKPVLGCSVCPKGSDFASDKAPAVGGSGPAWTFGGILQGSFSAPGRREALLRANGCESHANGNGGDFLLRRTLSGWQKVRYIQAPDIGHCALVPLTGGRDAAICEEGDMHQGISSDALIFFSVDEAEPAGDDGSNTAFLILGDEEGNCDPDLKTLGPQTLQYSSIDHWQLTSGADGSQQLQVDGGIGRVKAKGACPVANKQPFHIVYSFAGDHFQATSGLEQLETMAKDDCCELEVQRMVRPARY